MVKSLKIRVAQSTHVEPDFSFILDTNSVLTFFNACKYSRQGRTEKFLNGGTIDNEKFYKRFLF